MPFETASTSSENAIELTSSARRPHRGCNVIDIAMTRRWRARSTAVFVVRVVLERTRVLFVSNDIERAIELARAKESRARLRKTPM